MAASSADCVMPSTCAEASAFAYLAPGEGANARWDMAGGIHIRRRPHQATLVTTLASGAHLIVASHRALPDV